MSMKSKKAEVRAEVVQVTNTPTNDVSVTPVMNYELTILCLVCNCKTAKGGYNKPVDSLPKTEVLTLAHHNPRCQIDSNGEGVASVSSETEVTDIAHVTHYLIHFSAGS